MKAIFPLRLIGPGTFINYTYLVVDHQHNQSVLIDPSWQSDVIVNRIMETKSRLVGILLTHHHPDHTRLAPELTYSFDVPVVINQHERDYHDFKCHNLETISGDQLFSMGAFQIMSYHTPGHTKGSVCYQIENGLFTGDTLFIEGCGMCLDESSAFQMFDSVQKLKRQIHPDVVVYPGHAYGTPPGVSFMHLQTQNIYCHFSTAEKFASFRMRKHQTGLFNFR